MGEISVMKAYNYTRTYLKSWHTDQTNYMKPTYGAAINKISKGKVRFQIPYSGVNGLPLYLTQAIMTKYKNGRAKFR